MFSFILQKFIRFYWPVKLENRSRLTVEHNTIRNTSVKNKHDYICMHVFYVIWCYKHYFNCIFNYVCILVLYLVWQNSQYISAGAKQALLKYVIVISTILNIICKESPSQVSFCWPKCINIKLFTEVITNKHIVYTLYAFK